jgi:hypothetical protein
MTTSTLIREIQNHLEQFRAMKTGIPLEQLSPEDISVIKGYTTKRAPEPDYKRSWAKLAKAQRLNRLMNYHQKLTSDYQLNSTRQQQLKTLFYEGIDILDRDNVNYNQVEGNIIKIDGLKCDAAGCFYFETPASSERTEIPLQTIKKFTPISMNKIKGVQGLTAAQVVPPDTLVQVENMKKKVVIVRKANT